MNHNSSGDTRLPGMFSPWLVSMSDMMTLLLCFFLAVVALSPLNPHQKTTTSQPGIGLASPQEVDTANPPQQREIAVDFEEGELENSPEKLERLAQKVKNFVNSNGSQQERVVVEACAAGDMADPLIFARQRALELKRQLIDGGVSKEKIGVQILGENCAALSGLATGLRVAHMAIVKR